MKSNFKYTHDPEVFWYEYESLDRDRNIIAIYYIEQSWATQDHLSAVEAIALEGSTGTWADVPGLTLEIRKRLLAKALGYYPVPSPDPNLRRAVVPYAFPTEQWQEPNLPMLLTAVAGNILAMGVRLVALWFPEEYVKHFKGPKFGIPGLRELLRVKERPLVLSMVKPKTGLNAKDTAKQCYEAALGGIDLIKDDEMVSDAPYCKREERLPAVMEALDKADSQKGEKTLYFVNVTDEINRIRENADKAVEMGANAIMLNFTAGLSALRSLAEDTSLNVPILFHPDFASPYAAGFYGVSESVFTKLSRLAGADLWVTLIPGGKFHAYPVPEDVYRSSHVSMAPFYHIKKNWLLPGGGMFPGMVHAAVEMYGPDIVLGAGAGVHAHPQGTTAGARAFRQAVDALMEGVSLEEAAKTKPELGAAVEAWGIYKNPEVTLFKGSKTGS